MKVLGLTGTSEVYLASNERNFRINEFLLVEDKVKNYIGEVVEANTFNRFMPFEKENDFVDQSVIDSLYKLGYDVNNEVIYLAKLRLLEEAMYPIWQALPLECQNLTRSRILSSSHHLKMA